MSDPYQEMLAALRDGTGYVFLNVLPPRDVPRKQCMAYLWWHTEEEQQRLREPSSSVPITGEQARALLDAGAEWRGPAHLQAELVPG